MFRRKVSPLSSRVLRGIWITKNERDTCLQKVGNHLSTDAVALPSGRGSSVVVIVVVVFVWLFHLIFICITYFGLIGLIKKGLFYNWIPALQCTLLLLVLLLLLLMSLVTGLVFLVLLLNQRWSPTLRLYIHTAVLSVLCVMNDPSIAVFCSESVECLPGTASKYCCCCCYYYYYYYYYY